MKACVDESIYENVKVEAKNNIGQTEIEDNLIMNLKGETCVKFEGKEYDEENGDIIKGIANLKLKKENGISSVRAPTFNVTIATNSPIWYYTDLGSRLAAGEDYSAARGLESKVS